MSIMLHHNTRRWIPHARNVLREPGSSVSSVWLRTGRPGDRGSIPGRGERIFPITSVPRPTLAPTQPPVQWVPGVPSPGVKRGRGVTLTTHPLLVPRSRMSRSYTYSPLKRLRGVYWDTFSYLELYYTVLTHSCENIYNHKDKPRSAVLHLLWNKEFWKDLIRLPSLHDLTML
jgi:hypothetical protein